MTACNFSEFFKIANIAKITCTHKFHAYSSTLQSSIGSTLLDNAIRTSRCIRPLKCNSERHRNSFMSCGINLVNVILKDKPDAMSELSHNVFKHLFKRRLMCTGNPIYQAQCSVLDLDVVVII